ncbi:PD-(D/E)XK nuclease family protein [Natronococcus sp.]|uniref:PD-(D/E)XK nuclease family protein n=1 Tax=Natronococcus sp. TaxID=35747 RepID=UPI0025CDED3D|nr:PD-(D/E)XK nuclease family protein [Natronococcus sp.]
MTDLPTLTADGLETYLHCPRRYEFEHVHGLEGENDDSSRARVDLLREAICAALRSGATDRDRLEEIAGERLSELWTGHDEPFHSRTQRNHERAVLDAVLEAYLEEVGADHASGIDRLEAPASELIGPALPLASERSLPAEDGSDRVRIDAAVDYVTLAESSLVGVSFVPTLSPLGLLRYRSDWEGDVAALFVDHFDAGAETFEPRAAGALLETSVVVDGLRRLRERLDLEEKTCRYVQIPLADRYRTAVNWVQNTVDATVEPIDLTDVYLDHHTYAMTHEHRNETVDSRLVDVASDVLAESFDPTPRWDEIAPESCPGCDYAVGCQDRLAAEVRFDG